jgi:hypothetical protein
VVIRRMQRQPGVLSHATGKVDSYRTMFLVPSNWFTACSGFRVALEQNVEI